jgi:hypothetical protein
VPLPVPANDQIDVAFLISDSAVVVDIADVVER